jgi:hypothetical protein
MRCICLECNGKFKNSLAFSEHTCATTPILKINKSLLCRSFTELLRKDNTKKV